MANPILKQYEGFRSAPPRPRGSRVVTLDDVLMKTLGLFAVVLPVAAASFFLMPPATASMAAMGAGVAALVVSFIVAAKKTVSVPLMFVFASLEGVFLGGISSMFSSLYDGIVPTAIMAATITATVIIGGVKAGFLRTSPKARKIFFYFLMGYIVFGLVALGASLLGFPILTLGSPLALAVSVFGVAMACFSLVTDVEDISEAITHQALPEGTDWRLAFGLLISLVWLYTEILRLLANLYAVFGDN